MINAEFVERYQLELVKDPKSRVFAPLAEAYRKMGLLDEARRICERGCLYHPDFAGGHVAFAKVLGALKNPTEALVHLEKAARLSPDNLLAHSLMGETLIELRRPKDALKAFKMVLFLSPNDSKAQAAVRKWEFLTADEYEDPLFEMKPSFESNEKIKDELRIDEELESLLVETDPAHRTSGANSRLDLAERHARALDRAISLADAFTVRNDLEAAQQVVTDAKRLLGPHPELERRAGLLAKRLRLLNETEDETEDETGDESAASIELDLSPNPRVAKRRAQLEKLLQRISARRG